MTEGDLDNNIDLKNAMSFFFLVVLGEALNRMKKIYFVDREKYNEIIELANSIKHNYWKNRNKLILDYINEDFAEVKENLEDDIIKSEIGFNN